MKHFVFTYKRFNTITTSEYLKDVPHIVLCHSGPDWVSFSRCEKIYGDLIATCNNRGLSKQRNYALDMMKMGEWACFWVDDLIKMTRLVGPTLQSINIENQKLFINISMNVKEFEIQVQQDIKHSEEKNFNIIGFAVSSNTLFRAKQYSYRSLVEGGCFLIKKTHLRWDENVDTLDDQYITCANFETFGGVVRNNWILPAFAKNTEGGVGTREERMEQKMKEVQYLINRFPKYAKIVDKKGWPLGSRMTSTYKK